MRGRRTRRCTLTFRGPLDEDVGELLPRRADSGCRARRTSKSPIGPSTTARGRRRRSVSELDRHLVAVAGAINLDAAATHTRAMAGGGWPGGGCHGWRRRRRARDPRGATGPQAPAIRQAEGGRGSGGRSGERLGGRETGRAPVAPSRRGARRRTRYPGWARPTPASSGTCAERGAPPPRLRREGIVQARPGEAREGVVESLALVAGEKGASSAASSARSPLHAGSAGVDRERRNHERVVRLRQRREVRRRRRVASKVREARPSTPASRATRAPSWRADVRHHQQVPTVRGDDERAQGLRRQRGIVHPVAAGVVEDDLQVIRPLAHARLHEGVGLLGTSDGGDGEPVLGAV